MGSEKIIILIVLGLIIIYIIWKYIFKTVVIKKKVAKTLKQYPGFLEISKKTYDYTLENDKTRLYIKIVIIPANSMITINNYSTWKLSWGGSPTNPGRAYPHSKYLNSLVPFLEENIFAEKKVRKVILLYPKTQIIVKHINESELSTVTIKDNPYGYKIAQFTKFDDEYDLLMDI